MDNVDSNQLSERILVLNNNSGYPLPSKQELLLILNNADIKNMLFYSCNLIERQREIERIKKILTFNALYNDKLTSLASLKQKEEDLITELKKRKAKLDFLKENRLSIENKNQQLLNQTKANNKSRQLAELKNKILTSSKMELETLINKLDKLSFIENYKYRHQNQKSIGLIDNDENTDFDINTYIEKTFGLITLNNSITTQGDINTNKDKDNSTIGNQEQIQLPKIARHELKSFIQLNQREFWIQIKKSIEDLLNPELLNKKEKDSLFDQSSLLINNNNNENDNEYSLICKSFRQAIQKEEENLSIQYNENKTNDAHQNVVNENVSLIKVYKIPKEDMMKISSQARSKLAKDIKQYISSKSTSFTNFAKQEEFIIPQCIIKDDYNEIISYERNLIKAFKKYKQRTNAFISKRIMPLSDLLEEKYTDFTLTMKIGIDYFNKLKLKDFSRRNDYYSLGKLKYDKDVLSSFKVNSKYNLFSFYFKYIDSLRKETKQRENNKKEVDSIFKNQAYNEYLKKSKTIIEISEFNKTFNFDQKYHLFIDNKGVELLKSNVTLWGDIDYMNYDIDINSIKNRFL